VLPFAFTGAVSPVICVSVLEPVVVAHTCPFWRPTTRKLSSCGEMPIAVIGLPALIDDAHPHDIVVPEFVDR